MKNKHQHIQLETLFSEAVNQTAIIELTEVETLLNQYAINPGIRKLNVTNSALRKITLSVILLSTIFLSILFWPESTTLKLQLQAKTELLNSSLDLPQNEVQTIGLHSTTSEEANITPPKENKPSRYSTLSIPNSYDNLTTNAKSLFASMEMDPIQPSDQNEQYAFESSNLISKDNALSGDIPQFVEHKTNASPFYCSHYQSDSTFTLKLDADSLNKISIEGNKGDISVFIWDKDYVKIEAHLSVCAQEKSEADKMLSKFSFVTVDGCGNEKITLRNACCKSKYKRKNSSFEYKYKNKDKIQIKRYAITYTIYAPPSQELKLKNRNANILVDKLYADTDIQLSSGKLIVDQINAHLSLKLISATATITHIQSCSMNSSNSLIKVETVHDLQLIRSYRSKINLGTIETMDLQSSSNDMIKIKSISNLNAKKIFLTDLEIVNLDNEIKIASISQKSVNILYVNPKFKAININGNACSCQIKIGNPATYDLKANLISGHFEYPTSLFQNIDRRKEGGKLSLKASTVLKSAGPNKSKITLVGNYANFTIL